MSAYPFQLLQDNYKLAGLAKDKLNQCISPMGKHCRRKEFNLREVVGHANLLDDVLNNIDKIKYDYLKEQEFRLNQRSNEFYKNSSYGNDLITRYGHKNFYDDGQNYWGHDEDDDDDDEDEDDDEEENHDHDGPRFDEDDEDDFINGRFDNSDGVIYNQDGYFTNPSRQNNNNNSTNDLITSQTQDDLNHRYPNFTTSPLPIVINGNPSSNNLLGNATPINTSIDTDSYNNSSYTVDAYHNLSTGQPISTGKINSQDVSSMYYRNHI